MKSISIQSYDNKKRVADYDADMDLMHPRRVKMVEIALEILPFESSFSFLALELGSGTGYFTQKVLEKYPNARIIAVEGAESMVELSRERLGELKKRINFRTGDFRNLNNMLADNEKGNLVFSSYALHHLDKNEKFEVIRKINDFLLPGGWFINADLIISESPEIEERTQKIRVNGILKRAAGKDERFSDYKKIRKFLDGLEESEGDKPLTINEDLQILSDTGFKNPAIFWLEYREVVYGAIK